MKKKVNSKHSGHEVHEEKPKKNIIRKNISKREELMKIIKEWNNESSQEDLASLR